MMTEVFWPIAAITIATLALVGWLRWLSRETEDQKTARELRVELVGRDKEWIDKFEGIERKQAVLETAIRNLQPTQERQNPLGRAYHTRSTG